MVGSLYTRRTLASLASTAACGAIGWSGRAGALPLTILFPAVFLIQRDRKSAYAVALVYYAASTWPLVPGANTFFGPHSNRWLGVGFWLAASCLLAIPWGIFYFSSWPARYVSAAAALAATTFPPIGLFGWASPLTSAGLLFPGFGWGGILATILLPPLIARRPLMGVIATIALIVTAHSVAPKKPMTRSTWAAINTTFGREPERPDPVREFQTATIIQQLADKSVARVVVFPEAAAPRWNDATDLFWEPTLQALAGRGRTVLLGTTVGFPGTLQRLNGVLIRGADKPGFFIQHVPVPFSMWRLFSHSGFPLRLGGPGTVQVAGERAGILICYEMLLTWPVLSLSLEHPTVLVGVANDYWVRDIPIPELQQMCISAWARLFSIPALMARNT
jgi:hypothetical protein